MTHRPKVELWTDGSGQRGPCAWAFILRYMDGQGEVHDREGVGTMDHATNNRAELQAVIEGLAVLKRPSIVTVYTDSNYVAKPFRLGWINGWQRRNWRKVKNPDLWKRLLEVVRPHQVTFEWVAGHAGIAMNERCDYLAGEARKELAARLAAGALEPA